MIVQNDYVLCLLCLYVLLIPPFVPVLGGRGNLDIEICAIASIRIIHLYAP